MQDEQQSAFPILPSLPLRRQGLYAERDAGWRGTTHVPLDSDRSQSFSLTKMPPAAAVTTQVFDV